MTTTTKGRKEGNKELFTIGPEKTCRKKLANKVIHSCFLRSFPIFSHFSVCFLGSALYEKKVMTSQCDLFPKKNMGAPLHYNFEPRTCLLNETIDLFKN